ncbi:MAG: AAA family ATPase [Nitrososphaerota archaeon]
MKVGEIPVYLEMVPPWQSVLLIGPPGVGKSRAVREFAEAEAAALGREFVDYDDDDETYIRVTKDPEKYYVFLDLRLSECEPTDFLGVPRDVDHYIVYKPLRWVHVFSLQKVAGTFFLDELTNVRREDILAQAYKLVLDRRAGYKKFSQNVRVIAAGNDPESSAIVNLLPAPLTNRFTVFTVEAPTVEEWIEYVNMHEGGVDPRIAGYLLRFREDLIHKAETETLQNFPTPRSWSRLNEKIKGRKNLPEKVLYNLAQADVGPVVASKFAAFCRIGEILPEPGKILEDPDVLDSVISRAKERDIMTTDVLYYAVATVAKEVEEKDATPAKVARFFRKLLQLEKGEFLMVFLMTLSPKKRIAIIQSEELYSETTLREFVKKVAAHL